MKNEINIGINVYPQRAAYVEGVKVGFHRFVEDRSNTLCPIKGLCELEDGTLELVPIEKIVFSSNAWMADMAWFAR